MATKTIMIEGTVAWAKVFESNRDKRGFEDAYVECDGAYTIDLTIDKANFDILAATGAAKASKIKAKEVEKFGETTVNFIRKNKDRFEWASGAPSVFKPDNTPWEIEVDGVIPNGSKGRVKVDTYTTSKATGTRLVAVYITEVADMEEKPEPVVGDKEPTESVLF